MKIAAKKKVYKSLFIFIVIFLLYLVSYRIHITKFKPNTDKNIFLSQNEGYIAVEFKKDNKKYWVIRGDYINSFFSPSGPSVYIYDENDNLVEWVLDIGDTISFREKWLKYLP